MLPLLAACGSLLDTAGLEREPERETAAPPSSAAENDPMPASGPRNSKSPDPVDATMVADIQEMLNELGYDPGPTDGIMGPRTKAAIQTFQATADMPVDGRISPALSAALQREINLGMGAAKPAASATGARALKIALTEPDGHDEQDKSITDAEGITETVDKPVPDFGSGAPPETAVADDTAAPPTPRSERIYGDAEEPFYEAGDNYIYSNGRIETAARIEGNLVDWVVNDGSRYTAGKNFVMPPIEWKSKSGSVQSTVISPANVKWPPARANEVVFLAEPSDPNAGRRLDEAWSGEWTCGTEGQSTIAVPAGRFDIVKIACEKTSGASSQWRRRVWYYSADIRHYVRKEETTTVGGQPTVVDLIAARPGRGDWSRSARTGFNWAIQKLLERGTVGESVEWNISDNGIEFEIALTSQMSAAGNVTCRRYTLTRKKPGQPRIFPALACRDVVSGRWKIPGLEKGSIMPADVLASRHEPGPKSRFIAMDDSPKR
jgi:peptidoglycan hydrolase-like protein with peptidoglycan-binding domain